MLSPGRATIYGHHLLGSRISEDPDVHRSCVNRLMLAIATAPDVLHVEIEALRYKSSNMAAARLVQAGGSDNTAQPLWDAGLNGAGQVIQIGDTGVDQYHCMFHDDDTGIVATSAFSGTVVTDLSKRKVVQYLVGEYGDSYDCAAENGHGTHVSSGPKIDAALILDTYSPYTRLFCISEGCSKCCRRILFDLHSECE